MAMGDIIRYSRDIIGSLVPDPEPLTCQTFLEFIDFYNNIKVKPPENQYKRRVPTWRKNCRMSAKELNRYMKNTWKPSIPKNSYDKVKQTVIHYLNKLNDKYFTIITKEFIDALGSFSYLNTYEILIDEIMKKVESEKKFLKIYSRLVYELSINKKWQKKIISVNNFNDEYYWIANKIKISTNPNPNPNPSADDTEGECEYGDDDDDEIYTGPFYSQYDALMNGFKTHNFSKEFITYINRKFMDRENLYFRNMVNVDNDIYYRYRNSFLNLLEFIFNLYNIQYLKEDVLLHCLVQLVTQFEKNGEIENLNSFIHIYNLYKGNGGFSISKENHEFFTKWITSLVEERESEDYDGNPITIRTVMLLNDIFNFNHEYGKVRVDEVYEVKSESSVEEVQEKEIIQNIKCMIEEYPSHECWEGCLSINDEIPELYDQKIMNMCFQKIVTTDIEMRNIWIDLIIMLLDNRKTMQVENIKNAFDVIIENYDDYSVDYPMMNENFLILIEKLLNREIDCRDKYIIKTNDEIQ